MVRAALYLRNTSGAFS
jgi:hypothetical protein